ncbi:MAG TPA: caspase family protein [Leptolyngbya sp.]|nr:caspase family protein [Leptolyngbya sp.]
MSASDRNFSNSKPTARRFQVVLPSSYASYSDRWAIVVGISKYKHDSLNLKYADRDAESLYNLLISQAGGGFEQDHIVKLTNEAATTTNITRALRSFLKKPAREDLVMIYFACHGGPDLDRPDNVYLLTHDTDPNDISGTALPMREIDLCLRENLLAEKAILLADTCHSAALGGTIGRRSMGNQTRLVNRYLQEVSVARGGIALLTSAEANEVSFEDARWDGHGVFTYYLLQGMQGAADVNQNGFVTIGELFEYVRDNVKRATDHKQHPCIGTNPFDRELPLAITFQSATPQLVHQDTQGVVPHDRSSPAQTHDTKPEIQPQSNTQGQVSQAQLRTRIFLISVIVIATSGTAILFSKFSHNPQPSQLPSATAASTSKTGVALVVAPPSNVRTSPNGSILCIINSSANKKISIDIYGKANPEWYYTDFCGTIGMIHHTQIKFER